MRSHDKQTVLVVEDNTLVRMHGVDMLEEAGFTVLEAETADAALVILQQHEDVELLFSDVDMPGSMDGVELARRVHDRWPWIALLLTSGHHNIDEDELPDGGRFVRKPWTQERLMSKIQAVLETRA